MAASETFANLPSTTVSSGGTDAPAGGTSQSWTVASSSSFPAAATGVTQFHVADPALPTELITVTNVSGTTWTVTRGAESTTPVAHAAGFTVNQVVSGGALTGFLQTVGGTMSGAIAMGSHKITGLANGTVGTDAAAFGQIPIADATAADIQPDGAAAAGANGKWADSGHAHPYTTFAPSDTGMLAWNYDIVLGSSTSTPTTNVVNLVRVNIRQAISVTNVVIAVGVAGSGLTSSQNLVGLYNSAGTLIGTSADQTAAWGSAGIKTAALAGGPYALSAGTFVWVAIVSNTGTSTPGFVRTGAQNLGIYNLGLAAATARYASNGTATTAFAGITPSSNTLTGVGYWVALS